MRSRVGLQRRLDAVQATRICAGHRKEQVDWSLVTDAEINRLEALAMQMETCRDDGAFLRSLAPETRGWLYAVCERLGIALAAGEAVA